MRSKIFLAFAVYVLKLLKEDFACEIHEKHENKTKFILLFFSFFVSFVYFMG